MVALMAAASYLNKNLHTNNFETMDKKQVSNEECMYQSVFNFVELSWINVSESESSPEPMLTKLYDDILSQ